MGDCWNEEGFKKYRKNIIEHNKEVGKTFKRAYRYIGAARIVHDDWSAYNSEALNISKLNGLKEELKEKILQGPVLHSGTDRHLFATAFTPDGIVTFIDTLYENFDKVYVLNGDPGTGKTEILNYIFNEALKRGFYIEVYHDPLIPERIEHLLIPEISTAILTSNEINKKTFYGNQIYMSNLLNSSLLKKNKVEIENDETMFYTLLNKGLEIISQAKSHHDELEKYYIENMNFDKVTDVYNKVLNKLLQYEEEYLNEKL